MREVACRSRPRASCPTAQGLLRSSVGGAFHRAAPLGGLTAAVRSSICWCTKAGCVRCLDRVPLLVQGPQVRLLDGVLQQPDRSCGVCVPLASSVVSSMAGAAGSSPAEGA